MVDSRIKPVREGGGVKRWGFMRILTKKISLD